LSMPKLSSIKSSTIVKIHLLILKILIHQVTKWTCYHFTFPNQNRTQF